MMFDRRTILFIDEIHRFSRSQQDALLHAVENRTVVMIGATTENPYFEVNSALLSRSRVVELEHLADEDVERLVRRALSAPEGLDGRFSASDEVVRAICTLAAGDGRSSLTTLELASEIALTRPGREGEAPADPASPIPIELEDVKQANPRRGLSYDKSGDMHYDIISAFINSMRGSDPDAAVYWLARMIDAGEDPTENPYFEVNSALLSRSRVVELEHLADEDVERLVRRALSAPEGLDGRFSASDEVVRAICTLAAGDGRSSLTTLELASEIALTRPGREGEAPADPASPIPIELEDVKQANPRRGLSYDKSGDMHYDIISAFINSMRGSDPDAAVYWLARMIDAGEDPKFIARRIMIQASEDIGNADPTALLVAEAAFKAAEVIGYPECRINLAQAAIYNSGVPHQPRASRHLQRPRAQVECRRGRHRRRSGRRSHKRAA